MTVDYQKKYFPLRWTKHYEPPIHIHKDTQWPCPNGWHIGTQTEWEALETALETLWVWNRTNFMNYLKVPSAYYLGRSNGSKDTRYWPVRFWTSTMTSNTVAYCMYVNEKNALAVATDKPGNAFSIRPFLDYTINPTPNSEIIIGSLANWWILWDSVNWMLFISADWTNWITIADKNLWATNVWDDWLYYQFWNNRWFTVSPSDYYTSKISNTQWYWPGNYYDDKFVRVSSWNGWFTDTNNNLWWWVTNGTWTDPV